MSDFLVLFNEKEGSSHLMLLLDQFSGISVLHQTEGQGWEPFDEHLIGTRKTKTVMQCIDLAYTHDQDSLDRLNKIYMCIANRTIDHYDKSGNVGFKMRFAPPRRTDLTTRLLDRLSARGQKLGTLLQRLNYQHRLFKVLRKRRVVTLFCVRQDLLRWALSKYHGDGSGAIGHMQFNLATGDLKREDIPPIHVDIERLGELVADCREIVRLKLMLREKMEHAGIRTELVFYENYLSDPQEYFRKLFRAINHPYDEQEVDRVLSAGSYLKKVHSEDISEFVQNYEEIEAKFATITVQIDGR